jgi:hypothetical protein
MTSNIIYHYVYRITNLVENKHYYGKRSSKIKPILDLGHKYFSSSRDKNFIQDQKANPTHYKYKIVANFETSESALTFEIKLHNKFNVGINPHFYNLAKQSSTGFNTTGLTMTADKRKKLSDRWKGELNPNNYRDQSGSNNPMFGSARFGELNPFYGKKHTEESILRMRNIKLGKKFSEETKKKLSLMRKGVPKNRDICPNCGKEFAVQSINGNGRHIKSCLAKIVV